MDMDLNVPISWPTEHAEGTEGRTASGQPGDISHEQVRNIRANDECSLRQSPALTRVGRAESAEPRVGHTDT